MSNATACMFLQPCDVDKTESKPLIGFIGSVTRSLGVIEIICHYSGERFSVQFHVVPNCENTLLYLKDCVRLRFVTLSADVHEVEAQTPLLPDQILKEYSDPFGNKPVKYRIKVGEKVDSVVRPVRSVTLSLYRLMGP